MVQSELSFAAAPAVLPSTCTLYRGDCLDVMPTLKAGSVQMVFADLPYGVHKQAWDSLLDLDILWPLLWSVCTLTAAQLFTATNPFAHTLLASNIKNFRYDLIWNKRVAAAFSLAKYRPLPIHEMIYVFGKGFPYNPQMVLRDKPVTVTAGMARNKSAFGIDRRATLGKVYSHKFPSSIVDHPVRDAYRGLHPTQKPVALLEWLIATYTTPGDTVLDPVFGSNTTAIACARLSRNYIGIEKDAEYFRIGTERVNAERLKLGLAPSEVR